MRSSRLVGTSSGAGAARSGFDIGREFGAKHRGKFMVGAGLGIGGMALSRRRRSGLDKTPGRPTGIYKY